MFQDRTGKKGVQVHVAYYRAGQSELGLLRLTSGSLVFTALPEEASISLSGNCLFLFDCARAHRIKITGVNWGCTGPV